MSFERLEALRFTRLISRRTLGYGLLVCGLAFTSCKQSQSSSGAEARASDPKSEAKTRATEDELVIFAATSLRDVFSAMGEDFKRSRPGVELRFNFAGTQELRTQLEQGAADDVFASADQRNMDELVKAARVEAPVIFARNEPVIVVSSEAVSAIASLEDLPSAAKIVLGAPEVPIGRYTLQIFDNAAKTLGADFRTKVEAKVVSREVNVRQVLNKISLGEAQAGIVYRTDARAAQGKVSVVDIPSNLNVIAQYPIAMTSGASHPKLASDWIEFVIGPEGQAALQKAAFLPPLVQTASNTAEARASAGAGSSSQP